MSQDYFEEIDSPRPADGPTKLFWPYRTRSPRRRPGERLRGSITNSMVAADLSSFATFILTLFLGWCVYQGCSYDPAAEPATTQEETR